MASVQSLLSGLAVATALLATPSKVSAIQDRCMADPEAGTGVLDGAVLDIETAFPLHGAEVRVSWTNANGRSSEREVATDPNGEFRVCDAPVGTFLSVIATWYGERGAADNVRIDSGEVHVVLEVASPHVAVTGQVREEETGASLASAAIRIGHGAEQLSDEQGAFRFERIPPGLYGVTVERIGFKTVHDSVAVNLGTSVALSITLSTRAVTLEPIEVVVRSLVLERAGFYVRRDRGLGTFITREDIERRPSINSSDIIRRIAGVRLVRDRFNDHLAIGRGNCPLRFVIDGTRINQGFSIDEMPPHWFEGIEVYHGLSQVPIQFGAGPSEPNADCGVIVIWTRNRR